MDAAVLPKPVKVSPLIRFARWTMLISGIYFGVHRKIYFTKLANKRRQQTKARKDALILKEKVHSLETTRVSALSLAKEFGYTLPPEWSKPCYGKPCEEVVK